MIKLYTSSNCPACVTLKGRLDRLGLTEYEECSVNDNDNRAAVVALGFRGIPVLARYNANGALEDSMMGATLGDLVLKDMFVYNGHGTAPAHWENG